MLDDFHKSLSFDFSSSDNVCIFQCVVMEKMIKKYCLYRCIFHDDGTCTVYESYGNMDSKTIDAKDMNDVVMWLNKNGVKIIGLAKGGFLISEV